MNTQRLVAALFTMLFLCFGNLAMANDVDAEMAMEAVVSVNINEADAETIAGALVGVGITRAQAIVQYREEFGKFYSAEELTAVKGIGQSTVEKNLSRITTR